MTYCCIPKPPEAAKTMEPNSANLVAYYTLDGNTNDSSAEWP